MLGFADRLVLLLTLAASATAAKPTTHVLGLDDVLGMTHLDGVAPRPGGRDVAVVIQRPARIGEVYGRTAYETDPSRDDVWLLAPGAAPRNLTNGVSQAAGFWCASWSPDGRRLAMLSTAPAPREPRGGDNVRLYVWDPSGGPPRRLGDYGLVTQTRYGSAFHRLDLRGGIDAGSLTHACNAGEENAPFLWLDAHRLLAVTLPPGQVSGLIDEADHPSALAAVDRQRLREGKEPTGVAVGSGGAAMPLPAENSVVLRIVDADTGCADVIATIPVDPFRGTLMVSVSANGSRAAVMTPVSQFGPAIGERASQDRGAAWMMRQRLGLVDLRVDAGVRWLAPSAAAPQPLDLFGWAPDGRRFAASARAASSDLHPWLMIVDAQSGEMKRLADDLSDDEAGETSPHERPVLWLDGETLLGRRRAQGMKRDDWWRMRLDGSAASVTAGWADVPAALRRLSDGRLVGISGTDLVALDPSGEARTPLASLAKGASFVWPLDPALPSSNLLMVTSAEDGTQTVRAIDPGGSPSRVIAALPKTATPLAVSDGALLWRQEDATGLFLNRTELASAKETSLLARDTALASIDWGRTRLIDYRTSDGTPTRGAVILPPDYVPGRRYPTLVWVYEGYRVSAHGDYFLDPRMPGLYNLQLYAAHGYVVLIPSMPLPDEGERRDVYAAVGDGVFPAIDTLVTMGIADPDRLGVFGQSFGGYSVYALVTQTGRFKAAVALAGLTDLAGMFGQFDPLARGYAGIAHEKSSNWFITDQFGEHQPPFGAALEDYRRNSPLSYADHVTTPLLMLHGTGDVRGSPVQAEQFFYSLYAQNKTARLVEYGGESHSLAQSPANVRDAFGEILDWFDRYVRSRSSAVR